MKKLLTLLLSAVMVMAMMPGMAFAETVPNCTDENCVHQAAIGTTHYTTLGEAVNASQDNDIITLLKDVSNGDGVIVPENKNFTLDFAGHNYIVTQNMAGSGNTKTQAFQLLKGSVLVFKNGTIKNEGVGGKMVIQNYSNLTLEDMTLDGSNLPSGGYVLSMNNGKVKVGGNTKITASVDSIAFDVSYWPKNYPDGTQVILDTSGEITGNIEIGLYGDGNSLPTPSTSLLDIKNVNHIGEIKTIQSETGTYGTGMTDEEAAELFKGKCLITGGTFSTSPSAYVAEGYEVKSSDTSFTVVPSNASGITLNSTTLSLEEGKTATLTATVTPDNAAEKTVTWTSSDAAVATVVDGVVTAVKEGTATITATTKNGLDATCTVTVTAKPVTPPTGGGSVTPPAPKDPVTNEGTSDTNNATTNADISKDTTSKTETTTETKPDGTTSTTTTVEVSDKTAAAIVDKAVEHQSAEVVVDTTTSAAAAAPAEGDKTEVKLPADTIQTLAEKTTADVTIKSDVAEVTMDAKAVEAVAEQIAETKAETVTLVVENTKNEAEEMHFELNLVTESGKVHEFNGGNVSVTVKLNKTLQAAEKLVCIYIDDNGVISKVEGYKNADGTFTFITGHFSTYAIMAEDEADKLIEEQTNARLKTGVENTTIKLKSALDGKAIKLSWTKSKGYKVDYYEVYKSTKKANGYGTTPYYKTKDASKTWYKNTKELKKGVRYYYKVRGVREIGGKTVYTKYSTKAWRLVK